MKTLDLVVYGAIGFVSYRYIWPQIKQALPPGGTNAVTSTHSAGGSSATSGPLTKDQAQAIAVAATTAHGSGALGHPVQAVAITGTATATGWHFVLTYPGAPGFLSADVDATGHIKLTDNYGNVVLNA